MMEPTQSPFRRRCLRTLDHPIEIFGLEPEDWMLLLVGTGIGFVATGIIGLGVGLGSFWILRRLKRGKPAGYLFYLMYRSGWIRIVPRSFWPPHLLNPPAPWEDRESVVYSGYLFEPEQETYWPVDSTLAQGKHG